LAIELKRGFPGVFRPLELRGGGSEIGTLGRRSERRRPFAVLVAPDAEDRFRQNGPRHAVGVVARGLSLCLPLLEPERNDQLHRRRSPRKREEGDVNLVAAHGDGKMPGSFRDNDGGTKTADLTLWSGRPAWHPCRTPVQVAPGTSLFLRDPAGSRTRLRELVSCWWGWPGRGGDAQHANLRP